MSPQVRIIPAALSAAIVLFGFGYLAVGRGDVTDVSARIDAAPLAGELARTDEIATVYVRAPRVRLPLSVSSQS